MAYSELIKKIIIKKIMDNFKFFNLPFERGETLFSKGFFYFYGYSQTIRTCKKAFTKQQSIWKRFSVKTTVHIHRLFEKVGFDEVFGRSAVMELLGLKGSGASKLLSNLVQADIIELVSGHGKEKYKFKK